MIQTEHLISARRPDVSEKKKKKKKKTDETVNYILSEWSKLPQKEYKTKHDWVGKVIHLELCKILKFEQTSKLYVYKLEYVLENKMQKTHWDFEIQLD